MFIVQTADGHLLEKLPRENYNEDYREAYSHAFHKYGRNIIFKEANKYE